VLERVARLLYCLAKRRFVRDDCRQMRLQKYRELIAKTLDRTVKSEILQGALE
jgi:hypothetical protein